MTTQAIQTVEQNQQLAAARDGDGELTVEEIVRQVEKVQQVMKALMRRDEHYGVIPGTSGGKGPDGKPKEPKPTLLKAGAEKLCLVFRLAPRFTVRETWNGDHLTVESTCTLYHIPTGQQRGEGMGSCSTRESKYAFRKASRVCPECAAEAIIKGKPEYGGGWVCFQKKGGCGAKFNIDDPAITEQEEGARAANPDLADVYNTVLKMANKRSLVAATLITTGASDIFTQDLEDLRARNPEPTEHGLVTAAVKRSNAAGIAKEMQQTIMRATSLVELREAHVRLNAIKKAKSIPAAQFNALLDLFRQQKEDIEAAATDDQDDDDQDDDGRAPVDQPLGVDAPRSAYGDAS